MLVDELVESLDTLLGAAGLRAEEGEEYRDPPLDVARYYTRVVKLGWMPVVDQVLSVVAVVHQPADVSFARDGYRALLDRLASAAHVRFPRWPRGDGLGLALTTVVVTPEPISPDEDPKLGDLLAKRRRSRVVPLAIFRLNLGQEAMSLALAGGLGARFPEVGKLADDLTGRLGRFLPTIED